MKRHAAAALLAALLGPAAGLESSAFAQFGETPAEIAARAGRVGVHVERRGDVIVVDEVDAGTAAERAGLKVGDQVLRIDLAATDRFSASDAMAALRGLYGSRALLTVLPRAQMLPRTVEVERDVRVYLDSQGPSKGAAESVAAATPTPGAPSVRVRLESVDVPPEADREAFRAAIDRGAADVSACLSAVAELLPSDLAGFSATLSIAPDEIRVRTQPPSADLASCLGRKAAGWSIPRRVPLAVGAAWSISRSP